MNSEHDRFTTTTSMDGFVWAVSIGVVALAVILGVVSQSIWITVFLVVISAISLALNPTYYSVDQDALRIHRPLAPVTLPLADIVDVSPMKQLPYIRVFGVGGLGGYVGMYWSKWSGLVRMYGRNRRNPILIKMRDGSQIVIMPDDLKIVDYLPKS